MQDGIYNATIDKVSLSNADHGALSAWVYVTHECGSQGFGGYRLYGPGHGDFAGRFIWGCLRAAGVSEWEKMPGKNIRIRVQNGLIKAIGHIVEDVWFTPGEVLD